MAAPLSTWGNFYVVIGTASATLTGLMFVVITLVPRLSQRRAGDTFGAFSTPSVVHYCAALGVAAVFCAPWPVLWEPGVLLGLAGLGGLLYMYIVLRRTRRQTAYAPVLEDVIWHIIFPLAAYSALIVAALVFAGNPTPALFVVGAATMLLLFIGIHNAWDNVTYMVLNLSPAEPADDEETARARADERPTPS